MKSVKTTNEFVIVLNCLVYKTFAKAFFLFLENKELLWSKDIKKIEYRMEALVFYFKNLLKTESLEIILDKLKKEKVILEKKKEENRDFVLDTEVKAMLYHMYCFLYTVYCILIEKIQLNRLENIDFIVLINVLTKLCTDKKWEYKKRYKQLFSSGVFKKKAVTMRLRKKQKVKKDKFFVVENTNLKLNLFFHHSIIQNFVEKINFKNEFTFEDYKILKTQLFDNIMELHFIIVTKSSEELLKIVINCKKYLVLDLVQNPNKIEQFAFDEFEKQHYDLLIKVLEDKKNNNEIMSLDLNTFLERFAQFKKDD